MKKFSKFLLSLVIVTGMLLPSSAFAYTIDQTYNKLRMDIPTNSNYITLHETGTYAPAVNNAIYFNREWWNVGTYTSFIVGDGGKVYQVSPTGKIQWGAGDEANYNSPAQIELSRTNDKNQFAKDYPVYVNLARDMALKYGVPLTLDGVGRGIKSHLWFTQNFLGDHTDPYGYLTSWGISKAQLARDLQTGLAENGSGNVNPNPAPSGNKYKVGQNVRFTTIYNNPNDPISKHINANQKWTAVGTIVAVEKGRINPYRIENSGKLLGYANDGDIAELWNPTQPSSQPNKPQESGRVAASGTFYPDRTINIRNAPSTKTGVIGGQYHYGMSVNYDSYIISDGYVWISYINYSGSRSYMAVGPYDNDPDNVWGAGFR